MPAEVGTSKNGQAVGVLMPLSTVEADKRLGSMVVTLGFVKTLNLPIKSLAVKGRSGYTIGEKYGKSAEITQYSTIEFGVLVIWRTFDAIILPSSVLPEEEIHLWLGRPWFEAVNAKIRDQGSLIKIGDSFEGEDVVKIFEPQICQRRKRWLVQRPDNRPDPTKSTNEEAEACYDSQFVHQEKK